jgi:hypothetical protein
LEAQSGGSKAGLWIFSVDKNFNLISKHHDEEEHQQQEKCLASFYNLLLSPREESSHGHRRQPAVVFIFTSVVRINIIVFGYV